jgi:hypothetical protein
MAEPSIPELRRFAAVVTTACATAGAIGLWRGHAVAPAAFLLAAIALGGTAAYAPAALAPFRRLWLGLGAALGRMNTAVLFSLLYWAVLTPVSLVVRRSRDPLDRALDDGRSTQWMPRRPETRGPERWRRLF